MTLLQLYLLRGCEWLKTIWTAPFIGHKLLYYQGVITGDAFIILLLACISLFILFDDSLTLVQLIKKDWIITVADSLNEKQNLLLF